MSRLRSLAPALPISIAAALMVLWFVRPVDGPAALLAIVAPHVALASLLLVPVAAVWRDRRFVRAVGILLLVVFTRFTNEWISLPPLTDHAPDLRVATWNIQPGGVDVRATIDKLASLDVDVIALEGLTPSQATAIEGDPRLVARYPSRALYPGTGVQGIGLLSRTLIKEARYEMDPATVDAAILVQGSRVGFFVGHVRPPVIGTIGGLGLPIDYMRAERDAQLGRLRARLNVALHRTFGLGPFPTTQDELAAMNTSAVVLGDFNAAPTERAYTDLTRDLQDVHVVVGGGPGWTWRPSSMASLPFGLLRIDLILASDTLRPVGSSVDCVSGSDHCVLSANLDFRPPG